VIKNGIYLLPIVIIALGLSNPTATTRLFFTVTEELIP